MSGTAVVVAGTVAAVAVAGTVAAVEVVGTVVVAGIVMEVPPISKVWVNDHVLRSSEEGNGCGPVLVSARGGGLSHHVRGIGLGFGAGRPAPSSYFPCPFLVVLGG